MRYNWPDRIKIVLVSLVMNTIIGMFIAGIIASLDCTKIYFTKFSQVYAVGYVLSVIITIPIFLYYWRQLRQQENSGNLPDMNDMRNISPRQLILFLLGLPFLIASVVLFQLYSKTVGLLCLIPYVFLWVVEALYTNKRRQDIAAKSAREEVIN